VSYDNPYRSAGRGCHRLWRYFGPNARGRTVLRTAGVYRTTDYPTTDEINAASEVYLGGHWFEISEATATELQAAGYTTYDTRPAGSVHGVVVIP